MCVLACLELDERVRHRAGPGGRGRPLSVSAENGVTTTRRQGTWRAGSLVTTLLDPAARARGFAEASLLSEWPQIVGPSLAARCHPMAVRFERGRRGGGTLVLQAGNSAALELQHSAPQLVERVNRFFGYPAVRALRFLPSPTWQPHRIVEPAQPPPLTPHELESIETAVRPVADASLRDALAALGRSVRRRTRRAPV
jgi:hypothetical protein